MFCTDINNILSPTLRK